MATPKIQIGKLEFDEIKESLVDYLKGQDNIKDYDFTGSVAQVLLDVLAYNTLYQAFYMNMIANESFLDTAQRLESIISLVKPLGYVVPGKVSAIGQLKVRQGGTGSIISRYTPFRGNNSDGIGFTLYTNQDYILDNDGEADIYVYEGKSIHREIPVSINQETQRGFLTSVDIDLRTLKVEVLKEGETIYEQWEFSSNINQNITNQSKVYFIERTELGYFLVFGGRASTGNLQNSGNKINPNDRVRVTYIKSSGANGNGIGAFKALPESLPNGGVVSTTSFSFGGLNEPDIETIKFFAPKWFAAQDRAVTKDDCTAIISQYLGLDKDYFTVWGGEEMNPPIYGRVFVSSINPENQSSISVQGDVIETLKQKMVVTIIPEFLLPIQVTYKLLGPLYFKNTTKKIATLKAKALDKIKELPIGFNKTIRITDIVNLINSSDESFVVKESDISIQPYINLDESENMRSFSFKQKIDKIEIFSVSSTLSANNINIESYGFADPKGIVKLRAYTMGGLNNNIKTVINNNIGTLNVNHGNVKINKGVMTSDGIVYATLSTGIYSSTENIFLNLDISSITITPATSNLF